MYWQKPGPRNNHGSPKSFDAGLIDRRMQRAGRADAHAFSAADAFGEQIVFARAGRAEQVRKIAAQELVGVQERHAADGRGDRRQRLPPARIVGVPSGRLEMGGEGLAAARADRDAIQAKGAFGRIARELLVGPDRSGGADARARAAVVAFGHGGFAPENRNLADQSEHRPERT